MNTEVDSCLDNELNCEEMKDKLFEEIQDALSNIQKCSYGLRNWDDIAGEKRAVFEEEGGLHTKDEIWDILLQCISETIENIRLLELYDVIN